MRPRRIAIAVVLAAVIAIPAAAFAGKLGDLLGISNDGTPVSVSWSCLARRSSTLRCRS